MNKPVIKIIDGIQYRFMHQQIINERGVLKNSSY